MRAMRAMRAAALTATVTLMMAIPAHGHEDTPDLSPEEAAAAGSARAVSTHVDEAARRVRERVSDYVQRAGASLTNTFGVYVEQPWDAPGIVVLETDAPADVVAGLVGEYTSLVRVHKTRLDKTSRRSDTAPFYGGAGVRPSGETSKCSTGFTVKNVGGFKFMVTAGHCFDNGQAVVTENGGVTVGTVTGRINGALDMALIRGRSYDTRIFTGGTDSATSIAVSSAGNPAKNVGGYCHSGRTTGERCSHTVKDISAMACFPDTGCMFPVVTYTGGVIHIGGDSGAPFFAKSNGMALIRGMAFATAFDDADVPITGYVEPWSRIANRYGVTIAN